MRGTSQEDQRHFPEKPLEQQSPTFGHQGLVLWKTVFPQTEVERGGGDFVMIQVYYIYSALHFHYYYISSTSDHQALDQVGDPCPRGPPYRMFLGEPWHSPHWKAQLGMPRTMLATGRGAVRCWGHPCPLVLWPLETLAPQDHAGQPCYSSQGCVS